MPVFFLSFSLGFRFSGVWGLPYFTYQDEIFSRGKIKYTYLWLLKYLSKEASNEAHPLRYPPSPLIPRLFSILHSPLFFFIYLSFHCIFGFFFIKLCSFLSFFFLCFFLAFSSHLSSFSPPFFSNAACSPLVFSFPIFSNAACSIPGFRFLSPLCSLVSIFAIKWKGLKENFGENCS